MILGLSVTEYGSLQFCIVQFCIVRFIGRRSTHYCDVCLSLPPQFSIASGVVLSARVLCSCAYHRELLKAEQASAWTFFSSDFKSGMQVVKIC